MWLLKLQAIDGEDSAFVIIAPFSSSELRDFSPIPPTKQNTQWQVWLVSLGHLTQGDRWWSPELSTHEVTVEGAVLPASKPFCPKLYCWTRKEAPGRQEFITSAPSHVLCDKTPIFWFRFAAPALTDLHWLLGPEAQFSILKHCQNYLQLCP